MLKCIQWCYIYISALFGWWRFTSLQHLMPYQDRYWLLTEHTHDNVIVLPHWEIKPAAPWHDIPLSPCHILIMLNTKLGSDNYQFYKALVWLDWKANSWSPPCESWLNQFGRCVQCIPTNCVACSVVNWTTRQNLPHNPHSVYYTPVLLTLGVRGFDWRRAHSSIYYATNNTHSR